MDNMKPKRSDRIVMLLLLTGVIGFGFIFPDSLGDHDKMVHFAAHFGMSFLISWIIYVFSRLKLNLKKSSSYFLLIGITLVAGSAYKWMELISQGKLTTFDPGKLFQVSGYYTSMSQNLSGILATLLMISYFLRTRNRLISLGLVKRVNRNNGTRRINQGRDLVQDLRS
jgi:hypothetical protein